MKPTKAHIRQQDQTDCGVACLKAALNYFALAPISFERLRELSGTSVQGTTMLGLLQAAKEVGLNAEGFEADLPSLKDCEDLCIFTSSRTNACSTTWSVMAMIKLRKLSKSVIRENLM